MIADAKSIKLKDGTECTLRSPEEKDADSFIDYLRLVSQESEYLMRGPDDPLPSQEEEISIIKEHLDSPYKMFACIFRDDKIIGSCNIRIGSRKKIAHRAELGLAVLKAWWGKGIGSILMTEAERAAVQKGARQMELQYIDGNDRGIALYRKCGFKEVGRIPDAFLLGDNCYRDEIYMIKFLAV